MQRRLLGLLFVGLALGLALVAPRRRRSTEVPSWVVAFAAAMLAAWMGDLARRALVRRRHLRSRPRAAYSLAVARGRHPTSLASVPAKRDQLLRDRLILTYAPLVKYVAGRLGSGLPAHVDEGDLVSYGLLGLISAIERYDPDRDVKFETYAIARIKGSIIDELRQMDWVPRSVRARARDIERAITELEAKLGRRRATRRSRRSSASRRKISRTASLEISRSSIAALDELWTTSRPAATRSR